MTFCGGGARGGARGLFAFGLHPTSSLPPSRFVDFQRRGSVHSVLSVDDTFNDSASSHFSSARNDRISVRPRDRQAGHHQYISGHW